VDAAAGVSPVILEDLMNPNCSARRRPAASRRQAAVAVVALCLGVGAFLVGRLMAQGAGTVSLTALGVAATQNFDTLGAASSVGHTTLPAGWRFAETGTNANTTYFAMNGTLNAGDTYSLGASNVAERAFGGLQSGSLVPTIGAAFVNDTGATIASLEISYVGEEWRLGTVGGRTDRLDFQFSTTATSLSTGTWTDVDSLDFTTPSTTGAVGARDGNSAPYRTPLSATISNLSIAPGATFFIRWSDFNASGADDALGVDDFSITPRGTEAPTGIGSATPASVEPGGQALLTVTVTPGTNPPSTGIAVAADLTAIGGSATQSFTEGPANVFTYAATVGALIPAGTKTLPVVVSDAAPRSTNTSISLTVLTPTLTIEQIQGSGAQSPYAASSVRTTGIVTGIKAGSAGGYFIQMRDEQPSALPTASRGLFVFTGSALPAEAVVGNELTVSGTVQEYIPSADPLSPPLTEIARGAAVEVRSSGNPLPAAVTLTAAELSPSGSYDQLERFEGMLVHVAELTVVGPTDGFLTEKDATSTSNGLFYGVVPGVPRPFREPGVQMPDPLPAGSPCCVPRFDSNPEIIAVDTDGQPGGTAVDVGNGMTVAGLTGPLDYALRAYTILLDPNTTPTVSGSLSVTPVSAPGPGQFTVATFNMERFYNTVNDPGGDVVLTSAAFELRLDKASQIVRLVMRAPDIIGVQEVENLATLQAIAGRISADAAAAGEVDPQYQAFLVEGNDTSNINVGFLVKSADARVSVIAVTQEGKTTPDPTNPLAMLNDRPPLVLRAEVQPPSGAAFPVTVINNHLRSLNDIASATDGERVRAKRAAQAEFLANLIQTRQLADPNERIISVGDYNAYQFNDGYVDVIGTVKGTPTPATQVVKASADLVNPDLANLLPTNGYSYVFGGSAQELDHVLVTANLLPRFPTLQYARVNADFPEVYRSDAGRPERLSDHDPVVAYFSFPTADLSLAKSAGSNPIVTGSRLSYTIAVENGQADPAYSVVVSDQVPAGTSFVSMTTTTPGWTCGLPDVTTGIVGCTTASLAPGGTATLTLTVDVPCALADTTPISNTATVTSVTYDPDPTNNTSTSAITASNPAPVVIAPPDAAYQCASEVPPASASAATVTDNCGTPVVTVNEENNGGAGSPASPLVIKRTFTAVDSAGGIGSATQTITVIDNTPPVIGPVSVDTSLLWPANHKMRDIALSYTASDNCSKPALTVTVSSNEPVNGMGDGDTAPDWIVADATHLKLRAERSGTGKGRVYTIHVIATDAAGNSTVSDVTVKVPHSR
jgi:uncharacterized protein